MLTLMVWKETDTVSGQTAELIVTITERRNLIWDRPGLHFLLLIVHLKPSRVHNKIMATIGYPAGLCSLPTFAWPVSNRYIDHHGH